ncbi:AAA family ATPase [Actinokineospora sp. UTMC 2448]|uniref:helix-turn-helix transcriptional regulator n=1 Tax=Actinokineospora sp. UTMC 2448 TaxID=2268449 RepID=UPI0021641EC1|nr:AAA family ATPase [Actinokineospora sp. UTMC 2448]
MAGRTPLVGRRAELRALLDLVRAPAVVRIDGEAGVGKTRLLAELREQRELRGRRWLCGAGQPLREPLPLAPLIDAVLADEGAPWCADPLLGALVPVLPELGPRLPPGLPPLGDVRAERHRVYRALRTALAAACPAVLVLDDLHWTDDGTADFLHFLAGRLPAGLSVVLAHRPGAPDLPGTRLRLDPLNLCGTAEMLHAMVRERPPAAAAEALLRRTGGVPFAIEEVVRTAVTQGAPWDALDGGLVPDGFAEAIATRLDRLDDVARRVVHAAAVLGAPATAADLLAVAEVPAEAGEAALDAVTGSELREHGGRYGCRHELAEQAVLRTIGPARARRLHRRAAEVLLASAAPPHRRVGDHLRAAGDVGGWLVHAELAADRAVEVGDTGTAVGALRELLTAADDARERSRLALKLGRAALDGVDVGATVTLLRELLATVDLPPSIRGELRADLGLLLLNQASAPEDGYRELELAAADLRGPRPDLAARVMSSLANVHAGHHHIDVHLRWLAEAEALADALTDPRARVAYQVNRVTTLMTRGEPGAAGQAEWILADPPDAETARHHTRGCLNLVDAASWLGHYDQATRFLDRARRLDDVSPYVEEQLQVASVLLDWLSGRWTGLRQRAADLAARQAGLPRIAAECRVIAGALAAEEGDAAAALPLLRAAAGEGPPPVLATARVLVAQLRHQRLVRSAVVRGVDDALGVIRRTGMWVWATEVTPIAVELLSAMDRQADAERVVDEHRAGVAGLDCPAAHAALALADAVLAHERGDLDAADAGYRAAAALTASRPQWHARTLLRHAECLFAAGRDGVPPLRAAERLYSGLGAVVRAERCREVLRAHHALPGPKRGRPGYGDKLSPREREAARLAAAGCTNRQIAAGMGLSVRTVEQHVARALHKLGVDSRRELTAVLGPSG